MEDESNQTQQPRGEVGGSLDEIVERLKSSLEAILEEKVRKIQSLVDKSAERTNRELSGFREQLERLKQLQEQGLTEQQALWQMEIEEKLKEVAPKDEKPGKDFETAEVEFLKKIGLTIDAPQVVAIIRETPDPVERMVRYAKLAKAGIDGTSQQANPSTFIPVGASGSTPQMNLDEEYRKEVAQLRRGDVDGQFQLIKKYRQKAKETGAKFSY